MDFSRYEIKIKVGGMAYPARYTVAAYLYNLKLREEYGDMTTLPESLQQELLFKMATVYINGAIKAHNIDATIPLPLMGEEDILYLAFPDEIEGIFNAVAELTTLGNMRSVQTEDEVDPTKKANAE